MCPYPVPSPTLVRTLVRLLRQADVVHVQDAVYATSVASLIAARRRRVPSVLTQHVAFVPQGNPALDAIERIALATIARAARLATIVATLNPAVADWAAKTWRIAEPRVLPVGVPEPPGAGSDRAAVRRSFGLSEDRFVALFVGRDVPKKGLDVFLAGGDPAYELVAVTDRAGSAPARSSCRSCRPSRLGELLHAVDAFVLPSEGEGFPLTLQEAFATGLPVVTTMQPGYEHYLDRDDVLVIERTPDSLRAALERLAGDPALQRAARRALARSRRRALRARPVRLGVRGALRRFDQGRSDQAPWVTASIQSSFFPQSELASAGATVTSFALGRRRPELERAESEGVAAAHRAGAGRVRRRS